MKGYKEILHKYLPEKAVEEVYKNVVRYKISIHDKLRNLDDYLAHCASCCNHCLNV